MANTEHRGFSYIGQKIVEFATSEEVSPQLKEDMLEILEDILHDAAAFSTLLVDNDLEEEMNNVSRVVQAQITLENEGAQCN